MARQVLLVQGAGEGAHEADAKLVGSLRDTLGPDYHVRYPAMPDEADVDYETWKAVIAQELHAMGEGAIVVGHSVGASVLIRMFADRGPKPAIAGLFLVAAPSWHEDNFWRWNEAMLPDDAGARYPSDIPLFLYHGGGDAVVPVSHLAMYAEALPQGIVRRLTGRDHQLGDDMTEVAYDITEVDKKNPRQVLDGYARDAPQLIDSFDEVPSADVYAPFAHLLPEAPAKFVDVGAGTGRDAAWLAAQGHCVLAVEPTDDLRTAGMELHPSPRIAWLADRLPELALTRARGEAFDRVIVCAVWQHLHAADRKRAMPNIARLLAPGGLLMMVLRHEPGAGRGPGGDGQRDDAEALAKAAGLGLVFAHEGERAHADPPRRVPLTWLAFGAAP